MTVRLPGFEWHPLPEAERQPLIVPTQCILHTVVGHSDPYGTFNAPGNGSESHGWVPMSAGDIPQQYVSLHRSADANAAANRRAISLESQDLGPATIQETPWSDYQVGMFARIMVWCASPDGLAAAFKAENGQTIEPIPIVRCASPDAPGWGYHSMWPKPNPWTIYQGKTCPGAARIAQFDGILERARAMFASVHSADVPALPLKEDLMPYLMLRDSRDGTIWALFPGGMVRHIGGAEFAAYDKVPLADCVVNEGEGDPHAEANRLKSSVG